MQTKYDLIGSITDKDTKMAVAKIYDTFEDALDYRKAHSTQFLSPALVSLVIEHFKHKEIDITVYGGYENAERVCVCFYPKNTKIENSDFNIDVLEVSYNKKYSRELKHSDFLGSLMGLQIKRDLIGDIIIDEEQTFIFVCSSISNFIIDNLIKVGRTNIKISKSDNPTNILQKDIEELTTTVTSLRADVVISKIFNLSRGEVKEIFDSGKVFINWVNTDDIAKNIKENDVITVRGYGRIKYTENNGMNKKGKISISYLKY